MLSAGALVTVTVSGEAKGLQTAADLLAAAVQELGDLPLTVASSTIDSGSIVYNAITFQWLHYNYKAVVTVSTPADTYEDATEVGAAVGQAFEDVAGSTPTGVQAALVSGALPGIGAPAGGSILPDIGNAISSNVHGILLIVVALVVLLVVAIGWGKNAGALARNTRIVA